jgi:hypothetical protein
MNAKKSTLTLAASAAALFLGGACATSDEPTDIAKVQCHGANGCKGQSECATAHSDCTGLNACKGKGWVYLSPEACETAGGTAKTG